MHFTSSSFPPSGESRVIGEIGKSTSLVMPAQAAPAVFYREAFFQQWMSSSVVDLEVKISQNLFFFSHAIVTYLINAYAENDFLYPSEPRKRALIDQRLHFDSGILFPALREATV